MATAIRREVVAAIKEAFDDRAFRLVLFGCGALLLFGPLLHAGQSDWLFEDSNVLPWTGPFPQTFRPAYWIWAALHLTTASQHHWLNLGVHALTSVMVGLVAAQLWPRFTSRLAMPYDDWEDPSNWRTTKDRSELAWACGAIFWLHPLAVPAVGYAAALPEMLVALGAVSIVWCLLHGWRWPWIIIAAVIMGLTLIVKESAIGVIFLPAVVLVLRPVQWKPYAGWILAVGFLAAIVAITYGERAFLQEWNTYPWRRWPQEMLPMAAQAFTLAAESWLPVGIAFQLDPMSPWLGAWALLLLIAIAGISWLTLDWHRAETLGILYVIALIAVRLVIPASNWPDRAPEMWYTQQWYPALPGMVWLLVGFVAGDASRGEPSAP